MKTFEDHPADEAQEQGGLSSGDRQKNLRSFDRSDLRIVLGLTLALSLLYWRTLTHGLLIDDSAEFQTMAQQFGHTHPTGYEVYTFIAGLVALIPIGDPATRVTAWSALAGALTTAVVYLTIRQLGSGRIGALVGSVSLALGATFWSQSVIAEVYTTGLLLASIILGSVLRWESTRDHGWLVLAGVAGGLSLGVHFTNGLFVPAIGLFLLLSSRQWSTWRFALLGAGLGIALAVTAFVIVDLIDPPNQYFDAVISPSASAWDLEADQIDGVFERLRFDWTARQFQNQMFSDPSRLMPERWSNFRGGLSNEVSLVGMLLSAVGIAALAVRSAKTAALLGISAIVQLVYAFNYEIGDLVYVFYLPVYLLLALLLGIGLDSLGSLASRLLPTASRSRGTATALLGVFALAPLVLSNTDSLRSGTTPAFEFESYPRESATQLIAAATVADLPADAVVLTDWELLYTYVYVANIEQDRSDLRFYEVKPADDSEVLAESLLRFVEEAAAIQPVFVADHVDEFRAVGLYLAPVRIGPTRMFRVLPQN